MDLLDRTAHLPFSVEQFDAALHDLSQPLTVLLCTLEFGADLESPDEMRTIMVSALRECERLRKTVVEVRSRIRGVSHEEVSS